MTAVLHHCLNTIEIAMLYSVVGCGFYLASISTRHFSFAATIGFLLAPYSTLIFQSGSSRVPMALMGLSFCGILGFLYQRASAYMGKKGARQGQMLIVSLAAMGIGENITALLFGSSSRTLSSSFGLATGTLPRTHISAPQLVVLVAGGAVLAMIVLEWRSALIGKTLQALVESRLNLSLRGVPVPDIEATAAIMGFILLGTSGVLWALDGRIKPAMCTEVGVIGAVTFIVGTLIRAGPIGLIVASAALAVGRLFLSLTLQGDWSMTAMLLVLGCALLFKKKPILQADSD